MTEQMATAIMRYCSPRPVIVMSEPPLATKPRARSNGFDSKYGLEATFNFLQSRGASGSEILVVYRASARRALIASV